MMIIVMRFISHAIGKIEKVYGDVQSPENHNKFGKRIGLNNLIICKYQMGQDQVPNGKQIALEFPTRDGFSMSS